MNTDKTDKIMATIIVSLIIAAVAMLIHLAITL